MKRLFIIGNGFDLHHQICSSYKNFQKFVSTHASELYNLLSEYFNETDLWADFEDTLAHIDIDALIESANSALTPYGVDDWKESDNHNYEFEIENVTSAITVKLQSLFSKWIWSLQIPEHGDLKSLSIEKENYYLNFNYTSTLEKAYNIKSNQIVFIHNKSTSENASLILGHSRNPVATNYTEDDYENIDTRIINGNKAIDDYFEKTYKNTAKIISKYKTLFSKMSSVEEIYVLGHSLSNVDLPYIQEIITNLNQTVHWYVSYYNLNEKKKHEQTLRSLGLNISNVTFKELKEF